MAKRPVAANLNRLPENLSIYKPVHAARTGEPEPTLSGSRSGSDHCNVSGRRAGQANRVIFVGWVRCAAHSSVSKNIKERGDTPSPSPLQKPQHGRYLGLVDVGGSGNSPFSFAVGEILHQQAQRLKRHFL
jgi:hypothetical protein